VPRAGLTAERVTRAAADLADEVGFGNVTISAVARRFGVADASVYSHVRGIGDLRARVAELAALDLADRVSAAVAGRVGRDALFSFADAYREFALAHPGRYAATQVPPDAARAAESPGHRRVDETTYALFHAYGLSEPDLTDAVRLVRSAFHGYVTLEASAGFGHPRDPRASWERGLEALHRALLDWPLAARDDARAGEAGTGGSGEETRTGGPADRGERG
jgi:AcrR family transcriptional regulator